MASLQQLQNTKAFYERQLAEGKGNNTQAALDRVNQQIADYHAQQGAKQQYTPAPGQTSQTTTYTPGTHTDQSVANPQLGPYQTANPNAPKPETFTFGEQAKVLQHKDKTYLDRRDDYIANYIVGELSGMSNRGIAIDDANYNRAIRDAIATFGGQVDYNNPDWLNTIQRLNSKIQLQVGASNQVDILSRLNSNMSKLAGYNSGEDIFNAISSGDISTASLEYLKQANPALYEQYRAYQDNKFNQNIVNGTGLSAEGLLADAINTEELFERFGLDGKSTPDIDLVQKMMEYMDEGKYAEAQDKYLRDMREWEKMKDDLMNIEMEVREQYKGTNATETVIQQKIAKRTKDLRYEVQRIQRELMISQEGFNLERGTLNDMMNIYSAQQAVDLQYEQLNMQKFGVVYNTLKTEQTRRDQFKLADIEYLRGLHSMKYQLDLQRGDITSDDPYIRRRAIENQVDQIMQDYDGLIQSGRAEMIERIEKAMARGNSFGDAVHAIMKDIRNKPQYQRFMAVKSGVSLDPVNLGGGLLQIYDSNGNAKIVSADSYLARTDPGFIQNVQDSITWQRANNGGVSQYDNKEFVDFLLSGKAVARRAGPVIEGKYGGQCGVFVNDLLGTQFTNLIEEKIAYAQSDEMYSPVPVLGGAMVYDTGSKYGHVGIVVGVSADGKTVDILDSNWNSDEKIKVHRMTVNSKMTFTKAKDRQSASIIQFTQTGERGPIGTVVGGQTAGVSGTINPTTGMFSPDVELVINEFASKLGGSTSGEEMEKKRNYVRQVLASGVSLNELKTYIDSGGMTSNEMDLVLDSNGQVLDPATGVPLVYRMQVWNMISATLKNAVQEKEDIEKQIRAMYLGGIPDHEAGLVYLGYGGFADPNQENFGRNLLQQMMSLPDGFRNDEDVKFISTLIKQKDYAGAVAKVEGAAMLASRQLSPGAMSEATASLAVKRSRDLLAKINQLDSSPIGVVSGNIENWLGKLRGTTAQAIRTDVKVMIAELTHSLAGTQITEAELRFLQDLIPGLGDRPDNFMNKLQRLATAPLEELNTVRNSVNLPTISADQLLNRDLRIPMYMYGMSSYDSSNINNSTPVRGGIY